MAALTIACSSLVGCKESEPEPVTVTAAQPPEAKAKTFTFAPPAGTQYVRTERRSFESSLIGAPLVRRQEQVLRWGVSVDREGDRYVIDQKLMHVTMKRNEKTTIDADVTPGAVEAKLIVDKSGHLVEVKGLEKTSQSLMAIKGADADELEGKMLTPEGLTALVQMRYQLLTADIVGRPATIGQSWTFPGGPLGIIQSRTITVAGMETCGAKNCARLEEAMALGPAQVVEIADALVKQRLSALGVQPGKITTKDAKLSMRGSILTEPDTMLNHGASLEETGHVLLEAGKQMFEVGLKGTTTYDYAYGGGPVASGR